MKFVILSCSFICGAVLREVEIIHTGDAVFSNDVRDVELTHSEGRVFEEQMEHTSGAYYTFKLETRGYYDQTNARDINYVGVTPDSYLALVDKESSSVVTFYVDPSQAVTEHARRAYFDVLAATAAHPTTLRRLKAKEFPGMRCNEGDDADKEALTERFGDAWKSWDGSQRWAVGLEEIMSSATFIVVDKEKFKDLSPGNVKLEEVRLFDEVSDLLVEIEGEGLYEHGSPDSWSRYGVDFTPSAIVENSAKFEGKTEVTRLYLEGGNGAPSDGIDVKLGDGGDSAYEPEDLPHIALSSLSIQLNGLPEGLPRFRSAPYMHTDKDGNIYLRPKGASHLRIDTYQLRDWEERAVAQEVELTQSSDLRFSSVVRGEVSDAVSEGRVGQKRGRED